MCIQCIDMLDHVHTCTKVYIQTLASLDCGICSWWNVFIEDFHVFPGTETVAKTGMILLAGEVTSRANVDYQKIVRDTIKYIGYDDSTKGLCPIFFFFLTGQHVIN